MVPNQNTFFENTQPSAAPTLGLSRRQFLAAGLSTAAALALPREGLAQDMTPDSDCAMCDPSEMLTVTQRAQPYTPAEFQPANPLFSGPTSDSIHGTYGEVSTTFDLRERPLTLDCVGNAPLVDHVRTYNCQMPGPTLYVKPGDKISIKLCNNLPKNPDQSRCEFKGLINSPACFNTTNMHFHGLHVSPASIIRTADQTPIVSSDDVLAVIEPAQHRQYCVWLPETHAPGTHWYHAHNHGSTAIQVTNGMAGAIIIQEAPENAMGITPDTDLVWLIHEVVGTNNDIYRRGGPNQPNASGNIRGSFLVNGKCQPTLTIQTNQLQRWRFINATGTPRGLMSLQLCRCHEADSCDDSTRCRDEDRVTMYWIAQDGISFYQHSPKPVTNQPFAPANRADFLVKLPAGRYKLLKGPYDYPLRAGKQTPQNTLEVLAYINVEGPDAGDAIPEVIPGDLPDYLQPIMDEEIVSDQPGSLDRPRTLKFQVTNFGPGGYKINSKIYKMGRVDHCVTLNTAERWILCNPNGRSPHPFHIHVNPFQLEGDLIDPEGPNDPTNWRWWDVIAVDPRGDNSTRKIRQRFKDYYGEFVVHCHILIHEDQGMMHNFYVRNDQDETGIPPCCPLPASRDNPQGVLTSVGQPCDVVEVNGEVINLKDGTYEVRVPDARCELPSTGSCSDRGPV